MIMNEDIVKRAYTVVECAKIITRVPFSYDQFKDWCYTLNTINALPHGKTFVEGYPVTEYQILSCVADLVLPSRICYTISDMAKDFKVKPENLDSLIQGKFLDPILFNQVSRGLAGIKKINTPALSDVGLLRTEKTLADMVARGYAGEYCIANITNYCPVKLTDDFYVEGFYTESPMTMFANWFSEKLNDQTRA